MAEYVSFTDWLRANGFGAVSQAAINKAVAEGEPIASWAIQTAKASGGKFQIPQKKLGMAQGGPVKANTEEITDTEALPVGTFEAYKARGVAEDLASLGADLEKRLPQVITDGAGDPESFIQEIRDFVSQVQDALQKAREMGDPEVMRAYKEMLQDANDLQASAESMVSEAKTPAENYAD